MRAVIYARASKRNSALEADVERGEAFAKQAGYEIVETITDIGLGRFDDRRGIQRLYQLIEYGKVDVIVAASPETFCGFTPDVSARIDWNLFLRHLARRGVGIDLIG